MKFTIKGLMLVVFLAAAFLALYTRFMASYIHLSLLAIPWLILLGGYCLWSWRCRRVSGIGFGGLAILINGLYALVSISPDYMLTPSLSMGWMLLFLPAIGGLGAAWAGLATDASATHRRPGFLCWALVVVSTLMPAMTISTVWPLRLAFLAYRPSLERLADQVENGQPITSPRAVGPFLFLESGVDPETQTVGLFTDPNPSGRTGFVRVHAKIPERQRFGLLIGTDTDVQLGGRWSYRQDD
jgi:hypothetical protein